MLTDSEDPPRPAPVFKSKRKVAKAKRRVRSDIDDDIEGGTHTSGGDTLPNTGPVSDPSRVSRWARYSALAKEHEGLGSVDTPESGSLSKGSRPSNDTLESFEYVTKTDSVPLKDAPVSADDPEYVVFDESTVRPLSSENKAYTKMALPAKTFSLKESHFRDSPTEFIPLDKEYADAYGNVSDEDLQINSGDVNNDLNDDHDIGHDFGDDFRDAGDISKAFGETTVDPAKSRVRDLGDMYDSEVSIDTDDMPGVKIQQMDEPQDILAELTEKLAKLDVGISLQTSKSDSLKESLVDLTTQREHVLAELVA